MYFLNQLKKLLIGTIYKRAHAGKSSDQRYNLAFRALYLEELSKNIFSTWCYLEPLMLS